MSSAVKLSKLHNDVQAALSHSILISISYMTQIYVDVSKSSILIPFFFFLSDFGLAYTNREDQVKEWRKNEDAIWTWIRSSDWVMTNFLPINSPDNSFTCEIFCYPSIKKKTMAISKGLPQELQECITYNLLTVTSWILCWNFPWVKIHW